MTAHGRQLPNQGIHTPFAWKFPNASARTSFAPSEGIPSIASLLTINDIGRLALQTDDNSGYLLSNNSPVTWVSLIGGSFNAGGDLSGSSSSQNVIGIQTNPVQSGILGLAQDGYVLTWINSATKLQFKPASGGLNVSDFLLDNEPTTPNNNYSNTFSGAQISQEKWVRASDSSNIKIINYSYTGSQLTQEVRSVYAVDGITILAQMTINYVYTGSSLTSETVIRNI